MKEVGMGGEGEGGGVYRVGKVKEEGSIGWGR